ncbi:hypothetical protein EPA93_06305 [Ktedonosporobacter rubrisoli]|uniref:Major facilitator superfamily (MFS) profile domain-containing protein n=1 Tax=Ktedonosporobacter rubrisoli TaxID=2509675 RepID=A0A4P6JKC6_KTERU|nr:MFS transporter [Ktedonosporobacter rubrisoli]QBD75637.1 hypothetical protein EPA93_06305 [Ktedonosporobacter rubrisoli]
MFFIRGVHPAKAVNATTSGIVAQPLTFWHLLSHSFVLQLLLLLIVSVSIGTGAMFEVALPALLHNQLHTSASGYGVIMAAFSIGTVAGSLAAGGLGKVPYRLALSLVCFLIEAALVILLPFMGSVSIGVVIMLGMGLLNGLVVVTVMSVIQGQLPMHLIGRVMSLISFAIYGPYPISVALAGVIVPRYGSTPVFLAVGLLIGVPALVGCLQRSFWQRGGVKLIR